jgi:hypothetical protein
MRQADVEHATRSLLAPEPELPSQGAPA